MFDSDRNWRKYNIRTIIFWNWLDSRGAPDICVYVLFDVNELNWLRPSQQVLESWYFNRAVSALRNNHGVEWGRWGCYEKWLNWRDPLEATNWIPWGKKN